MKKKKNNTDEWKEIPGFYECYIIDAPNAPFTPKDILSFSRRKVGKLIPSKMKYYEDIKRCEFCSHLEGRYCIFTVPLTDDFIVGKEYFLEFTTDSGRNAIMPKCKILSCVLNTDGNIEVKAECLTIQIDGSPTAIIITERDTLPNKLARVMTECDVSFIPMKFDNSEFIGVKVKDKMYLPDHNGEINANDIKKMLKDEVEI